ncbi:hypothetical protein SARC_10455 [Sphaeroforma arctica JP610]|uniref:Uncharacterized protein n=1 Tax=Sphaeroforma arctica JP610 TaxID=667725 RepID=A0A0L0FJY4_9EUKA|nr:hypothetical protein SARC_10455 [Sphaeroforma arctica JP610]KNC77074.1 hypothetical protein SARC_10455 [Sphaeroforma arctica JP610]|eukprot:XP_014150976.1 hypothetical protein SARC_10455 [Sphaeroforma arctica JP610]
MPTVNSKDIKTTIILESKVDWLPWKTQTILSVNCEGISDILTNPTAPRGSRWTCKQVAEAYRIINRTLSPLLQTEISQFSESPWDAFAALQQKFEALTEDDLQDLEAKLNRITQERNEPYATLISRLNTSLVKFKNAGRVKSDNSLCAILPQAVHDDNQTVKITLKTPAMMAMSYGDLTSYLTALDPDESDPSTIVHGAHSAISSDNCAFCNNRGHSIILHFNSIVVDGDVLFQDLEPYARTEAEWIHLVYQTPWIAPAWKAIIIFYWTIGARYDSIYWIDSHRDLAFMDSTYTITVKLIKRKRGPRSKVPDRCQCAYPKKTYALLQRELPGNRMHEQVCQLQCRDKSIDLLRAEFKRPGLEENLLTAIKWHGFRRGVVQSCCSLNAPESTIADILCVQQPSLRSYISFRPPNSADVLFNGKLLPCFPVMPVGD